MAFETVPPKMTIKIKTDTNNRMHIKRTSHLRLYFVYTIPHHRHGITRYGLPLSTIVYPCGFSLYWAAYSERWDEVITRIQVGSDINFGFYGGSVLNWVILGLGAVKPGMSALSEMLSAGADTNMLSDNAIKRVLKWDPDTAVSITKGWSVNTFARAVELL